MPRLAAELVGLLAMTGTEFFHAHSLAKIHFFDDAYL